MSPINSFNNLLLIENFFGIYRNYCSEKKMKKCFIILLIFVLILLQTIIAINELYLLLGEVNTNQIHFIFAGFSAAAYLSSVTSVITAICYSRTFMSYYKSISIVSERFKDDKKLINSLKKTYWVSITFILYSIAFAIFRFVDNFIKSPQFSPSILVPTLVSHAIATVIVVIQYVMFYVVVMIVVHLFKCLTSLVSAVQLSLGKCDISSDEECDITKEQIQGWVELYRELVDCSHKVMLCFGRQFFFSSILSTSHYILIMYYIFYMNVLKIENTEEYTRVVLILFGYVSVLIMPLFAGQRASNQGVKFRRVLVQLYNSMIIGSREAEAKSIKDFIRLIKNNPIEIKLLTNVLAGMYMLPVILTIAANYLIVMLQFNHII